MNLSVNKVHIAAITESWLTDEIEDDQISIGGYVIQRKDRTHVVVVECVFMCLSRFPSRDAWN